MRQYRQAELNTTAARPSRLTGRSRALAGAAVAVALGGLGAGLLAPSSIAASKKVARAASSPALIHACYNRRTGALRFISPGRGCGSGGVAISWAVAGVAGPPGAQGESGSLLGPRGVQGQVGPEGPPGERGPAGEAAPRGVTGETGPTGEIGATGEKGGNGINGPTGEKGTAGPPGENGKNGVTGATGPTGTAGPRGPSGATGSMTGPLPEGITESGAWSAISGSDVERSEPGTPRAVSATISFPIPLAKPPTPHYLNKAETLAGTAACPRPQNAEKPTAPSGNLCIYTTEEFQSSGVLANDHVAFQNVQNVAGETEKASLTGAFVIFETHEAAVPGESLVRDRGTWAVTG